MVDNANKILQIIKNFFKFMNMMQNKNIYDFYQSSGVYDRVIFNKKISNNYLTLNDLKKKN